ncbi:polyketide biosynthesis enoyl-CoA hydratase PksH [Saccharothrix coeruleofusca]|uniref:enoyl-CoA hydratase-related protein n=1 Tax=Saccharothrix coeruleofusca TaxID=33919 RepID=UPI001AE8FFD3|nr:enoyl-CoA hydratase-related protein [Saccharothrix coeruleofusca]MBP2336636.1 polyketide biosynthesis enoyl-CoA hydratase PksH [Saccharothrix coeruleofusca]
MDLSRSRAVASPLVREVCVNRGDQAGTIDDALVRRLYDELDAAEADTRCRVLLITSEPGVFSTGMDLVDAARTPGPQDSGGRFFDLLRRFTRTPLVVAAVVDGRVAGGGVGLLAACDLVLATPRSTFALPEALWGLLPCCVLPFLIRRTGFQRAYAMALTTRPLGTAEAAACGLVDEVADDPAKAVRRLVFRAGKLDGATVGDLKRYAGALWAITDDTRRLAVEELDRLMALPRVRDRLTAYAAHGRYPWES